MDPICHTLTGAALGFTGLEQRTRFARATMIIGANLPDVDAVTYFMDDLTSLGFRRGVTHGVPALIVLPVLLALAMKGLSMTGRPAPQRAETHFRQLWLLAFISMATHPVLDFLNNYGMRWLMPFVDRWVYGDTLYIIDPLVWAMLLAGLIAAGVTKSVSYRWRKPAVIALAATGAYILANAAGTVMARQATVTMLQDEPPVRFMASPVLMQPLRRRLVLEYADEYRVGEVRLLPLSVRLEPRRIPKGNPRNLARAAATRDGAIFLHWARFPFTETAPGDGATVVRLMDARYVREWEEGFGATSVTVD